MRNFFRVSLCRYLAVLTLFFAGFLFTRPLSATLPKTDVDSSAANEKTVARKFSLVPLPNQLVESQGSFSWDGKTRILYDKNTPEYKTTALYLQQVIRQSTGYKPAIESHSGYNVPKNTVFLKKAPDMTLGKEGYRLKVSPDTIVMESSGPAGVFYAAQTFLQLLPVEIYAPQTASGVKWTAPCVEITDSPAFKWRGMMLDCSRQFFTVEEIKRLLDQMAFIKLNIFHWHFTDDNGWRMEIKGYPRLTGKGATWEDSSLPDKGKTLFYSRDDIREIVAYAGKLHITVVPEIELPGHAAAAIMSYPELFCRDAQIPKVMKVTDFWSLYNKIGFTPPICITRPEAVKFMNTVLDQVMELFPSEYIHIGGDEVPSQYRKWSQCPSCSELMSQKGYKDENMQKYLAEKLRDYTAARGKKVIGWSEIFNDGSISGVTLMDWIGGSQAALQNGCEVIASPTKTSYLDYKESPADPITYGGVCTLSSVYNFDPGQGLDAEKRKLVLGSQGNLWTHIARNEEEMNFCLFPRLFAIAERNWTRTENKSYENFVCRLEKQLARLSSAGVNFNVPEPVCSFEATDDGNTTLSIHNPAGNTAKVFFTLDGTEPSENSTPYDKPVSLPENTSLVQAVVIVKEGLKSHVVKRAVPPAAGYYHWSFDTKSPDEKNGSVKTESREKATYVTGHDGKGLALRLSDEQAALSLNGTAALEGNWTFSMWVNAFSNKSPFSFLISGKEGSLRLLSGKGSGKVEASVRHGREKDFNYSLPLNTWTMLSFVQTGQGLSLYVNGVHKETLPGFVMALPMEMIGNNGEWGYKALNADLDEITIFPRALTAPEIEQLFKKGTPL